MPRGDGTGPPWGGGPGSGRGKGQGRRGGAGAGRMGGTRPGAGPSGDCVCPKCGQTVPHQPAVPCFQVKCPTCGISMVRQ
jgi:hypothetical protein